MHVVSDGVYEHLKHAACFVNFRANLCCVERKGVQCSIFLPCEGGRKDMQRVCLYPSEMPFKGWASCTPEGDLQGVIVSPRNSSGSALVRAKVR